ncbi:DUF3299 domain-containing protein [Cupriavidus plantarum]|uniref:DUF3299 domain-containing protein n=1 Tax=Cupriavidus plantarum TaxID=942865 RepID=UPI000EB15314|nr:DUF3299 domain-containing protein [Cupriavidus plantarum]RLK38689.1 hypothetical protein C7417_2209 [Cupriavidus plantarum]
MTSRGPRLSAPLLATAAIVLCTAAVVAGAYWLRSAPQRPTPAATSTTVAAAQPSIPESPPASGTPTDNFRDIDWQALLPKGWDPMAPFKGLKLDEMEDNDPRAEAAMDKARKFWQTAPIEPSLDGAAVRLPGFVVSLDGEGEAIREFLLVPYFGACIHVPPPPANQVVHVRTNRPLDGLRTMDTVWIRGTLRVERAETMMGEAGYGMKDAMLEPYRP